MACCGGTKDVESPAVPAEETTPLVGTTEGTTADAVEPMEPPNPWIVSCFMLCGFAAYAAFSRAKSERDPTVVLSCISALYIIYMFVVLSIKDANNHPAPEDAMLGLGYDQAGKARMNAMRANGPTRLDRVAVNNLENLPVALATLWGACSVGADPATMAILYAVFMGTRILYGVCYLLGIQPFRTIFWLAGNFTVIAAVVYGCLAAGIHDLNKFLPMLFTGCIYLMQFGLLVSVKDIAAHPPEDQMLGVDDKAIAESEAAKGSRLARVLVNAHEAVPMGLVTLWASYNSGAEPKVMMILFAVYFGVRFLYIPCYLFGLQPFRSMMYLAGQFSVISAASYGIIAAGGNYEKILPIATTLALFIMQLLAFHATADKTAHPAEDDAIFAPLGFTEEGKAQYVAERAEGPTRLDRLALNQHESFSMALIVLWGTIQAGANAEAVAIVFATYLGLRVIFALCYMCAIQPFRTLAFLLSNVALVAAIVFGFLKLFHTPL